MKTLNLTIQRQAVYDVVRKSEDHPTAADVMNRLVEQGYNLAYGTVYNSLRYLTDKELIRELKLGETASRYDARMDDHQHIMCEVCGKVDEVMTEVPPQWMKQVATETGYTIDHAHVVFGGVCGECKNQTGQVKVKWSGRRLPLRVKPALADSGSAPLVDNCPITRRVILISPMPGQVHELVKALTDSCFDVLVFHRWEPDLHERLVFDLLIYDLSVAGTIDAFTGIHSRLNREAEHTTPCLYLVGEKMIGSASGPMLQEELLVWPARPQEAPLPGTANDRQQSCDAKACLLPEEGQRIGFKDLTLDRERMSVQRDQERIHLTKTEYDLLLKLIDAKGAVISREEMLSDIWETDFTGGSNVVDVHIKSLRKKLGDNASSPQYIVTVRGVGYRLAD